jgi:hypothetical protein
MLMNKSAFSIATKKTLEAGLVLVFLHRKRRHCSTPYFPKEIGHRVALIVAFEMSRRTGRIGLEMASRKLPFGPIKKCQMLLCRDEPIYDGNFVELRQLSMHGCHSRHIQALA